MEVLDRFGCFGKLPNSREFLVEGQAALSAAGFDTWLGESIGMASMQLGDKYRSLASEFAALRFRWVVGTDEMVGVLFPSRDAAGRIHPFASLAWTGEASPQTFAAERGLLLSPVFQTLANLADRCRAASEPGNALEMVRSEQTQWEPDSVTLRTDVQNFLRTTALSHFWTRFDECGAPAPDVFQVVQALYETVSYLRGRSADEIRLGIRIPLSATGSDAGIDIAFWTEAIRALFRGEITRATFFWSHEQTDSPALHFFFSKPSAAQWSGMIDPASDLETISYLDRPYGGPPAERMDPSLRAALETPSTTMEQCLEILRRL